MSDKETVVYFVNSVAIVSVQNRTVGENEKSLLFVGNGVRVAERICGKDIWNRGGETVLVLRKMFFCRFPLSPVRPSSPVYGRMNDGAIPFRWQTRRHIVLGNIFFAYFLRHRNGLKDVA